MTSTTRFSPLAGRRANDTNIRLVRHYWAAKGQPDKKMIISRKNAYHGSTMGGASLGGMQAMHAQGGCRFLTSPTSISRIGTSKVGTWTPMNLGLERARQLEAKLPNLGSRTLPPSSRSRCKVRWCDRAA